MKIIFACSGMFRYVPECSGMFRVPGFIEAHSGVVNILLRHSLLWASIKPGTWNIPEHVGTFRNMPEHAGTSRNMKK